MEQVVENCSAKMLPQRKTLRLIQKARTLEAPKRAPRPGKRIKLGKNFDVVCKTCTCCKGYTRYFLRKRIDGVRHALAMTTNWDVMIQHMGWKKHAP